MKRIEAFAGAALFAAMGLAACDRVDRAGQAETERRIAAIENGLRPMIIVDGEDAGPLRLIDRMAHYNVPGLSIAVIDGGEIAWARGYGVREAGGEETVDPDTLFQAASISKPVAAIGALRLVEEGVLDLDRDVNEQLIRWRAPENEFTREQKVTLRRLMTHTAGLTVHGFPGYNMNDIWPGVVDVLEGGALANTDPVRVAAAPGSEWRYSGGGYTVMQLLIEDAASVSFDDYMKANVLAPAGMENSTYAQPLPETRRPQAATAHDADGAPVDGEFHVYPEQAAAGLWTTPEDLARLALDVMKSFRGEDGLLSQAMAREMLAPGLGGWGLGFDVADEGGGVRRFSHGGSNEGFRAMFWAYTDGRGAFVMTNGDNGAPLYREIIAAIAEAHGWAGYDPGRRIAIALSEAAAARISGDYALRDQPARMRVWADDAGVWFEVAGLQAPTRLYPESETEFFMADGPPVIFELGEDGEVKSVRIGNFAAGDRVENN